MSICSFPGVAKFEQQLGDPGAVTSCKIGFPEISMRPLDEFAFCWD